MTNKTITIININNMRMSLKLYYVTIHYHTSIGDQYIITNY